MVPEVDGGFASFDWRGRGTAIPWIRPCELPRDEVIGANRLACYTLLAWSSLTAQGDSVATAAGFRYGYAPLENALPADLAITHVGVDAMTPGFGLHTFSPRHGVQLLAPAPEAWT
jgi:hypothetical protein